MEPGHNSTAPTSPGADLSSKYTKLASEYSKVRAQLSVLKKAVVDEQTKSGDLNEVLRQRDQVLRKNESEMESLNFRNQQLAKRVEILQDELEQSKLKGTSGKKSSHHDHIRDQGRIDASESLNSVMGEELQLKIEENAKLHATLHEIDKKHEEKCSGLYSRIHELESRLSKLSQAERAEDAKQKELIHGLKVENVDLNLKISELERELADKNDRITLLQVQLESATSSPSHNTIGSNRFQTNTGPTLLLNSTEARIQTVELLSLIADPVQEFIAAMSDFHTYWEHRLKDIRHPDGRWSCESAEKLSKLLLQNVKYLKPIEESYQKALSDILSSRSEIGAKPRHNFFQFSNKFGAYVAYAKNELEPLLIVSLQHESNSFTCSPTQQAKNSQFFSCLRGFDGLLLQLAEQLERLVGSQEPATDLIENLTVTISKLHRQSVELSNVYSSKAVDENSLPTVSRQLINTNQCIVASLSNVVTTLNTLSHNLSDNLQRLSNLVSINFDDEKSDDVVNADDVKQTEVENVDVDSDFVSKVDELAAEIGNLRHEIESLNEKLKKAEQSKEHWKLEYQLLQMKHDKLKDMKTRHESTGQAPNDDEAEMEEIKETFMSRLDLLVTEKLQADSKAAHFYLECVALQKRLKDREKAKAKAEDELQVAEEQVQILREELGLTTNTYEGQLSLMTEHVATMNDKLATQTDQIDRLKYELGQAGRRK